MAGTQEPAANTFTAHFCTHVPERVSRDLDKPSQDVASQTSDHMISATVPGLGVTPVCKNKPIQPKMGNKVVYGGARRKTDSELLQLPVVDVQEPTVTHMKASLRIFSFMFMNVILFIRWTVALKILLFC
jgi:hypothetical protein